MVATTVRIRRTVAGGVPALTFAVDGPPCDDQLLDLDPDRPPIDAIMSFESTPDDDSVVIAQAGKAIHQRLAAHGNLTNALTGTLMAPVGHASREIRIHIEPIAKLAHNLPWETLLDPDRGFIALTEELPFSRIVPPLSTDSLRTTSTFDGKIKLVAVLAAAAIPGAPQWDAIEQAMRGWPADRREILVLVDRPSLKQQIEETVATNDLRGFAVGFVPATVEELVQRIGDHAPHILHIFCHGRSDGGGVLEIATPATALGQAPLYLRPGPLASAARSSFLVVLNACSTGAVNQAADTNSVACRLVEEGVPFVTSMRQQVAANVANLFARTMLTGVIRNLKTGYESGARFQPAVATAVMAARREIMNSFGPEIARQRRFKEWTLPILCTSSTLFEIHPVKSTSQQAGTETLAAIRTLRSILVTGSLTDDKRKAIENQIVLLELLLA